MIEIKGTEDYEKEAENCPDVEIDENCDPDYYTSDDLPDE
jgi:hypothetical protein